MAIKSPTDSVIPEKMTIKQGLPESQKNDAIDLFLDVFREEFLPVLGERAKAKELLALTINWDNCFFAKHESELLGMLAFQADGTRFFSPSFGVIRSLYGIFGGLKRAIGLALLGHKAKRGELYIEAIAVSEAMRGQGVGSELLATIFRFAREAGCETIALHVIDTNPRAKELYERLGFTLVKRTNIWPINNIIGWKFNAFFLMKRKV